MEKDEWLATIKASWDNAGRIHHDFQYKYKLNQYQIEDGLAFSAVVTIASQLSVVSIGRSLVLCSQMLDFLESGRTVISPINSALQGVEIELWRRKEVYHQFHPKMKPFASNDSVEDGVCQFLTNYLYYVHGFVTDEFRTRIKNVLAFTLLHYLSDALGDAIQEGVRDTSENSIAIQESTLMFSANLYPWWDSLQMARLPVGQYQEVLDESKQKYQSSITMLSLT